MSRKALSTAQRNAEKLIELLPRLLRGLLRREDNFLTQGKISFPQMLALEHLSRVRQCRMSDLAEALSIKMASATGLADRMFKSGYVRRFPDPRDRRVVRIGLLPKGQKVVQTIFEQKKRVMADVFKKIPTEDSSRYVQVFEKIVRTLTEES